LDIDIDKVREASEVFKGCMADYFMPPESRTVEPLIPFAPMPGGALTANTQMMRDNNLMDKFPDVLKAMTEVVSKGGFGTSVTPVSQFYVQQAFNNAIFGNWSKIAPGYGRMVLGYFGKTPCEPDAEVVKIASEQLGLPTTTEMAMDIDDKDPKKGRAAAEAALKEAGITDLSDENVFIAACCKEKGIAFLKGDAKLGVRKTTNAAAGVTVSLGGKNFGVKIEGNKATVNGVQYDFTIQDGISDAAPAAAPASSSAPKSSGGGALQAGVQGTVLRVVANVGDSVKNGDVVVVLEALKMEIEMKATCDGTIKQILVKQGDSVNAGQDLAIIE
jgi:pyruvate carboxylase subunit B